jgi:hypothetical protein
MQKSLRTTQSTQKAQFMTQNQFRSTVSFSAISESNELEFLKFLKGTLTT